MESSVTMSEEGEESVTDRQADEVVTDGRADEVGKRPYQLTYNEIFTPITRDRVH
jgi:hypothetical protein